MSAIIFLIKLIAAHFVGDFILQSDKMCVNKFSARKSVRYPVIAWHSIIQALLAYLFVGQWTNWTVPLVIGGSHFIIDVAKTCFGSRKLMSFVWDQIAHIFVIAILWWFVFVKSPSHGYGHEWFSTTSWLIVTSYILILAPTSILIKLFIEYENWLPSDALAQGLPNAGKWIGYLERILILTFIFSDNIEGIGFLLAAKSVFRFGELSKAKDIKITEYVLIGTFASFTIAILIGFAVKYVSGAFVFE